MLETSPEVVLASTGFAIFVQIYLSLQIVVNMFKGMQRISQCRDVWLFVF